jgi:hypothetical protein
LSRWQKLVGRAVRLVLLEVRKASWRARALARRKLEAPPDAGHEPREGETVRGKALTIKSTRWFGLWVSARRFSIRRKMFSGFCPYDLHRSCEAGSFGSEVNPSHTIREERVTGQRLGQQRGWSGVPTSDNESIRGRHGSVKAPRGPRRSKGSPHPRR